jgi:hypothetical protein
LIWLLYFVAMMAIDPFLSPLIIKIWEGKLVGIRLEEFALPESFVSVVIDNASWYGPQLLPTAALFTLLRLTGVRIQDTK